MKTAWVRITMATLVCPCGHEQPTGNLPGDHGRRPEQTCSRCGAVWFTPCSADCEPDASPLPKGGPAEPVDESEPETYVLADGRCEFCSRPVPAECPKPGSDPCTAYILGDLHETAGIRTSGTPVPGGPST